jgi:hypothetical protein
MRQLLILGGQLQAIDVVIQLALKGSEQGKAAALKAIRENLGRILEGEKP